ncbi:hypothetical protein SERLA73DRAFT_189810 [Serpula lacrymans var. lacrymans S7.3]|uniref:Uncharacterized protein n=1 Tax=Serpula lacrymans var. lacrymans (strain S7.3) TaxID=936435 RepID=F8QEL2_SERL3|nr:hypothetical protein SERLA73DRAFT_189810 [Serpula lacrymans var. lacrymans S7.3]
MASSMASQSPNSSSRHDRPVKGRPKNRSSLLTAHKGELTTVKGTFKPPPAADLSLENSDPAGNAAIDIDQELFGVESETEEIGDKREEKAKVKASEPAPSGDELLHIAGINEDATNLSDFEEDAPAGNPKSSAAADAEAPQSSVEVNKQTSPSALPSSRDISAAWKSSTIFGPLYLGVSNSHASPPGTHNDSASRPAFSVTFNTSMSIPVSFKDIYTKNGSAALDTIIDNVRTGPPGTFYGQNCALSLIHTLQGERTGARVTAEASEGNEGEKQFLHFYNRLHSGEVFLMMAGAEPLVFYSANNEPAAEWLATPQTLVGLPNTVLVCCVSIANRLSFADVAFQNSKETVPWSSSYNTTLTSA